VDIVQQYGQYIAAAIIVVILFRSLDFGQLFAGAQSFFAWFKPKGGGVTETSDDKEAAALQATKFLLEYFADRKCKPGLAAAKICGQHLLDHDDEPAAGV
jgi:hypothetical protein